MTITPEDVLTQEKAVFHTLTTKIETLHEDGRYAWKTDLETEKDKIESLVENNQKMFADDLIRKAKEHVENAETDEEVRKALIGSMAVLRDQLIDKDEDDGEALKNE